MLYIQAQQLIDLTSIIVPAIIIITCLPGPRIDVFPTHIQPSSIGPGPDAAFEIGLG
jgi:hypothetical protein